MNSATCVQVCRTQTPAARCSHKTLKLHKNISGLRMLAVSKYDDKLLNHIEGVLCTNKEENVPTETLNIMWTATGVPPQFLKCCVCQH